MYQNLKDKTEKEVLRKYLTQEWKKDGFCNKSSFYSGLIHARELTGRDLSTGKLVNEINSGNWAGACAYLILIDHLSGLLSTKDKKHGDQRYKDCIVEFGNLSAEDAGIIYSLRNAFLHKFNLYSIASDKRYKSYFFNVDRHPSRMIEHSKKDWSGVLTDIYTSPGEYVTTVSLRKIADLVENILSSILEHLDKDTLFVNNMGTKLLVVLGANTIRYQEI